MDEVQKQRAIGVITHITCALDRGVRHFDRSGRRLKTVSAIIEAWARGGGEHQGTTNEKGRVGGSA